MMLQRCRGFAVAATAVIFLATKCACFAPALLQRSVHITDQYINVHSGRDSSSTRSPSAVAMFTNPAVSTAHCHRIARQETSLRALTLKSKLGTDNGNNNHNHNRNIGRNRRGGGGGRGGGGDSGSSSATSDDFGAAFHAHNSTAVAESDSTMRARLRKSPLLSFLYRFWTGTQRRARVVGVMALYVLHAVQQHVLPLYIATSALQLLPLQWTQKVLQLCTRTFFGLAVTSGILHSFRNRVPALLPPAPQPYHRQYGIDHSNDHLSLHTDADRAEHTGEVYALVTGASSGIGREIAADLASRGWNLILVGRQREALRQHGKQLKKAAKARGKQLHVQVVEADLAVHTSAEDVYLEVQRLNLTVDVLVNSAGLAWVSDFTDAPGDRLEDILTLNCIATTGLTHMFAQDMKERKRGRILIVSSITGAQPNPKVAGMLTRLLITHSIA
jgi:short chain dehydrogenase